MAAIDPDEPLRLAKAVADLYAEATARLLEQVARRLAAGIEEPGWAEAKLAELGQLRNAAQREVNRLAEEMPGAVRTAVTEGAELGRTEAAREIRATLRPITNRQAVDVLAEQTIGNLTTVNGGILRTVDDAYRQVIAETVSGTVTGSETRLQSAQRAVARFADRGITGFRDGAGRNWEIESYAEMSTRTASGNAMVEGRLEVYQDDGRDLVIVSDAPEECELCRPFEGKILSISGSAVGVVVDGQTVVASVRDARSRGLFHPNCRHDLRPYLEGSTRRYQNTSDPEGDRQRQRQRQIERQIRRWKRRESAALTDDERRKAKAKVREWQATMREFIADTGRLRKPGRERLGAR